MSLKSDFLKAAKKKAYLSPLRILLMKEGMRRKDDISTCINLNRQKVM
jgi:hypothetical protein